MLRYFVIENWMISVLNLKGYDLLLFAVMYAEYQLNEKSYPYNAIDAACPLHYCKLIGCSRRTYFNCVKSLFEKGLLKIVKTVFDTNVVVFNSDSAENALIGANIALLKESSKENNLVVTKDKLEEFKKILSTRWVKEKEF